MDLLITGATGTVGGLVVEGLLARGARPRIFVRDAAKARLRFGDRVDLAVGDLADEASLAAALRGIDALFLVSSGPELALRDASAARLAKAAGVQRVVKLSTMDVEQQAGTGVWHAQGEAAIRATGLGFTFVRPSGFMVNALAWADAIKTAGVVRAATGDGRIAFIHPRDIAEVAVAALTTRTYDGEALAISGPAALSYAEMVSQIGAALGKPLRFEPLSDEEARTGWLATGEPMESFDYHLSIFRAIREGRLARVTDTVPRVLERPSRSFEQWVGENLAAFR